MFIPTNTAQPKVSAEMQEQLKSMKRANLEREITQLTDEKREKLADRDAYIAGKIGSPKYAQPSRESCVDGEEQSPDAVVSKIDAWIRALDNEIEKKQNELRLL